MHSLEIDPHDPDQSDGSISMTSTSEREGMPTIH
jgi:hypothetical protein